MAMTFEKTPEGKLKAVDTKVVETKYALKDLRRQKQVLKARLDEIQVDPDRAAILVNN